MNSTDSAHTWNSDAFFQCLLLELRCFYLGTQCEDGKEASAALNLALELVSRIETSGPDLPGCQLAQGRLLTAAEIVRVLRNQPPVSDVAHRNL